MYIPDNFWWELLEEYKVKKAEIIVKETLSRPRGESLFQIYPDDQKTYTKIINSYNKLAVKYVKNFLKDALKEKYNCPVQTLQSSCFDFRLDEGFLINLYAIKSKPSSVTAKQIDKMVAEQSEIDPFVRVHLIFLLTDDFENKVICDRFQEKFSSTGGKYFVSYLFEDFMEKEFCGSWDRAMFCEGRDHFKKMLYNEIGYQLTKLCTDENWENLKKEVAEEIQTCDYDNIKIKQDAKMIQNKTASPINERSYDVTKETFLTQKRYELLLGNRNFAASFLTSEWLYKNHIFDNKLDNTFIVTGYLKSIEQLLWDIIAIVGQGREIGNSKYVISETANPEDIKACLGALEKFLDSKKNIDLFLDAFRTNTAKRNVKGYLNFQLSDWRSSQRNGYFHKDNLNEIGVVDTIRNETNFLYMLILGSINLSEQQLLKLQS